MDPIPAELVVGAHPSRRLAAAGISSTELRGALWDQVLPGRWAFAATDARHPRQRALVAASVVPPDGAVGGWAAAHLLGARALDGSTPDPDVDQPVLLCLQRRAQRPWWPGIRPFRSDLAPGDVVEVDGAQVTSPVRTAFDLARLAPSLVEAVVALDAVLAALDVDLRAIEAYARARPRWRGRPRARAALDLADGRSASPQETRLRMLWVLEAGLPRPEPNQAVRDRRGHLLGEVDLLDVETGLVAEYDGAHHASADQPGRRRRPPREARAARPARRPRGRRGPHPLPAADGPAPARGVPARQREGPG